jgi:hypothetical protein
MEDSMLIRRLIERNACLNLVEIGSNGEALALATFTGNTSLSNVLRRRGVDLNDLCEYSESSIEEAASREPKTHGGAALQPWTKAYDKGRTWLDFALCCVEGIFTITATISREWA